LNLNSFVSGGSQERYTFATIDTNGLGLFSFNAPGGGTLRVGDLQVAHCEDDACTTATITTIDSTDDVGNEPSITLSPDGYGVISYYDATNARLKLARCRDAACTEAEIRILDTSADVGLDSSVTIGTDGMPLIAYRDVTNAAFKVLHCASPFCVDYQRRR
jgi:hypothetical protein